jgi:hypothetical protein
MPSLWFVVPAHGRLSLTRVCLRQLRRTCNSLTENGVDASAVIVADDENLDTARELGFATVRRDNRFLSRKFNDGIQLALDPRFNPRPADYVVPCGSDDWVDHRLFVDLPAQDTMVGFPRMSFVREDGRQLTATHLTYEGGAGIRIWPRWILEGVGYRPADEDRPRGCDTSILVNTRAATRPFLVQHWDTDSRWIVDWKSHDTQVNAYDQVTTRWRSEPLGDPFDVLAGLYPDEALADMRAHYGQVLA